MDTMNNNPHSIYLSIYNYFALDLNDWKNQSVWNSAFIVHFRQGTVLSNCYYSECEIQRVMKIEQY